MPVLNLRRGVAPISLDAFVRCDLPPHLYLEALHDGTFSMEYWEALLRHTAFILKLSMIRNDSVIYSGAMECLHILRDVLHYYKEYELWSTRPKDLPILERRFTGFGDWYRKLPGDQVQDAQAVAEESWQELLEHLLVK